MKDPSWSQAAGAFIPVGETKRTTNQGASGAAAKDLIMMYPTTPVTSSNAPQRIRNRRSRPVSAPRSSRRSALALVGALTATAVLTIGCDDGADDPALDIQGQWQSTCLATQQADGSTQYSQLDFDIASDTWAVDYTVHAADGCQSPLVTVHIEGPYEIGAPSAVVAGAFDGTFHFTEKTMTAHDPGMVAMLSSLEPCGASDWVQGEPQSVYQSGCPGFGQYPEDMCAADYDLVYVDGDELQFGQRPADNNMCQPELRPTALNPVKFVKQR